MRSTNPSQAESDLKHKVAALVDGMLDLVEFTLPIELVDVETVHQSIRDVLPVGLRLESYHDHRAVYFSVRMTGRREVLCERTRHAIL